MDTYGKCVKLVKYFLTDNYLTSISIFNKKLLVTDALWIVPTLVLSIVCAVRESTVQSWPGYFVGVNQGAFGAASVI